MAIKIKTLGGKQFLEKLGLLEPWDEFVNDYNVGFKFELKQVVITASISGDTHDYSCPIDLETINELKAGTLGEQTKVALINSVTTALNSLHLKANGSVLTGHAVSVTKPKSTLDMLLASKAKPGTAAAEAEEKAKNLGVLYGKGEGEVQGLATADFSAVEKQVAAHYAAPGGSSLQYPAFDAKKLTTAPLTQLRDATEMYQPVRGTSEGSRYYMIAANAGVKVAARYKNTGLSVRIEGTKLKENQSKITACGITNMKSDYASIHLDVPNDIVASKAIGAILMGLGIPFDTPLPDMTKIKNK